MYDLSLTVSHHEIHACAVSGNLHHFFDYSFTAERITNDFNGDQSAYTNYLVEQIQGPWASQAAGVCVCVCVCVCVFARVCVCFGGV